MTINHPDAKIGLDVAYGFQTTGYDNPYLYQNETQYEFIQGFLSTDATGPAQKERNELMDISGLAIWASVSQEVDTKIRDQIRSGTWPLRLKSEDWTSGEKRAARQAIADTIAEWLTWLNDNHPEAVEEFYYEICMLASAGNRNRIAKHSLMPKA